MAAGLIPAVHLAKLACTNRVKNGKKLSEVLISAGAQQEKSTPSCNSWL